MNKSIETKIEESYLLGCIKFDSSFNFYFMPIAWWILNHEKYDPDYNPNEWENIFRNNILNITEKNKELFLEAINDFLIEQERLPTYLKEYEENYFFLYFFIDLDNNTYINSFIDIEIESYLPSKDWVGKYDNPLKYLPKEIQNIWNE